MSATALVAIAGILGTLGAPFVASWGLQKRTELRHKHAEEARLRRDRIRAYRDLLGAAAACRACATKKDFAHSEQEQRELQDGMRATSRTMLMAYNTVLLFGSEETRKAAILLWDATYKVLFTESQDQQELERLVTPLWEAEDRFAAAAREELFPGELTPRA